MPVPLPVSKPFANPFESYGAGMTLVDNLFALETPEVEMNVVPASAASGQVSPSESMSNRLGSPSLSVLISSQVTSLK